MNILDDIKTALASQNLPIATGVYKGGDVSGFFVITPGRDRNDDIADDTELTETTDADINLYYKGNYESIKDSIKTSLKSAGFYIADSFYLTFEQDTGHHHYVITVEKKEVL